jgi:UDP-N-acetylglucosamine--N-acetylmuramyl-(pentapeptide) pyrophosphoryl-undecaprenol N-acetylglucosamine transferase
LKRIILTGGGTAGHVTPNMALIPQLQKEGWDIHYIGSFKGIEKELIEGMGIKYHAIASGKFRRYKNFKNYSQNFMDIFRVVSGISQATKLIRDLKPSLVFSKGGFVAVPVVLGAKKNKVPVIIHESDITPGLANKLAIPFAKAVCTTFPETVSYISGNKAVHTGTPIRPEIFEGKREKGLEFCGFNSDKPVIMVMGGSLGAVKINNCIRQSLDVLLKDFQVVHLCGKGNLDSTLTDKKGYKQFEYISSELSQLFACCDIIVSRAGSNSISEFLALKKPSLLIPLNARASRGDQILNAQSFEKQGFSSVLDEDHMTKETLTENILELYKHREKYIASMNNNDKNNGIKNVMELIRKYNGN